jgi:hypothetical protein
VLAPGPTAGAEQLETFLRQAGNASAMTISGVNFTDELHYYEPMILAVRFATVIVHDDTMQQNQGLFCIKRSKCSSGETLRERHMDWVLPAIHTSISDVLFGNKV